MAVPYCSEGNSDRNPPNQNPISPPRELVQKWINEEGGIYAEYIAARSAQWGWDQREPEIQAAADAELEAICHWLITGPYGASIACHAESMISDLRSPISVPPAALDRQP